MDRKVAPYIFWLDSRQGFVQVISLYLPWSEDDSLLIRMVAMLEDEATTQTQFHYWLR